MAPCSIELGEGFCHLHEIYPTNTEKIIGYCYKNRTRCYKTYSKKAVNKAAKATGKFIGNKIAHKIVKPKPMLKK